MKLSQEKIDTINEASLIAFVVSLLLFLALRIFRNNFAADLGTNQSRIHLQK